MKKPAAIVCLCLLLLGGRSLSAQKLSDLKTPTPIPANDVLVIGFMGGRDAWNREDVGVGSMAKRLREMNLPGVHVETVENVKRDVALEFVKMAFDRNRDGRLDAEELGSARLILYGQSFGGAAVAKFARQLQEERVPVMLTVQVDSVGMDDALIPANVKEAANLYQHDGFFIHGATEIRAANPDRTKIIGNFRYSYRERPIDISQVPWYKKFLREDHTMMDHDPAVWKKVEELVVRAIRGKQGRD